MSHFIKNDAGDSNGNDRDGIKEEDNPGDDDDDDDDGWGGGGGGSGDGGGCAKTKPAIDRQTNDNQLANQPNRR